MKETKETKKEAKEELAKEKNLKDRRNQEDTGETLVRIMGQDIKGSKSLFVGLTRIKGVSWAISNALCIRLGLDRRMKIASLNKEMVKKIEDGLKSLDIPVYMKNRRADRDTGSDMHLYTTDLDIKKEFDIKRLKQIKSYKGIRHSLGLPVRGQRTRSHFRAKAKTGVRRKNDKKA